MSKDLLVCDLVVYHGGHFMTTTAYQYVGPKCKRFKRVETSKLSVNWIRDKVKDVVKEGDRLFIMRDGVTPDHGFRELTDDKYVREMVHASRHTGSCKIHVYHEGSVAPFPPTVDDEAWYEYSWSWNPSGNVNNDVNEGNEGDNLIAGGNLNEGDNVIAGGNLNEGDTLNEGGREYLWEKGCLSPGSVSVKGVRVNQVTPGRRYKLTARKKSGHKRLNFDSDEGSEADMYFHGNYSDDEFEEVRRRAQEIRDEEELKRKEDEERRQEKADKDDESEDELRRGEEEADKDVDKDDESDEDYEIDEDDESEEDIERVVGVVDSSDEEGPYAYGAPMGCEHKDVIKTKFNPTTAGEDIKWKLGMTFVNKRELKTAVRNYSIGQGRALTYVVDDKHRIQVKCSKGCTFSLWASYVESHEVWLIKTLVPEHNCIYSYRNKLATSKYLHELYGERIRKNPSWKIREMHEEFRRVLKVEVGTTKCHRIRKMALSGVEQELAKHYAMLRRFGGEILRSNRENTVRICTTRENEGDPPHFKRFYVCYAELRKGWKEGCRPVLGLDGCFLKTVCRGQLLTAVGRDGLNCIYHVAMVVVESESYDSWGWFLDLLTDDLQLGNGYGYTLISDQQKVNVLS